MIDRPGLSSAASMVRSTLVAGMALQSHPPTNKRQIARVIVTIVGFTMILTSFACGAANQPIICHCTFMDDALTLVAKQKNAKLSYCRILLS